MLSMSDESMQLMWLLMLISTYSTVTTPFHCAEHSPVPFQSNLLSRATQYCLPSSPLHSCYGYHHVVSRLLAVCIWSLFCTLCYMWVTECQRCYHVLIPGDELLEKSRAQPEPFRHLSPQTAKVYKIDDPYYRGLYSHSKIKVMRYSTMLFY